MVYFEIHNIPTRSRITLSLNLFVKTQNLKGPWSSLTYNHIYHSNFLINEIVFISVLYKRHIFNIFKLGNL